MARLCVHAGGLFTTYSIANYSKLFIEDGVHDCGFGYIGKISQTDKPWMAWFVTRDIVCVGNFTRSLIGVLLSDGSIVPSKDEIGTR